jgi:hypothetical protein
MNLQPPQLTLKRGNLSSTAPEVPIKQYGQLFHNPRVHVGQLEWRYFGKLATHGSEGKKRDLHIVARSSLEDNLEGHPLGGVRLSMRRRMTAATINFENPC